MLARTQSQLCPVLYDLVQNRPKSSKSTIRTALERKALQNDSNLGKAKAETGCAWGWHRGRRPRSGFETPPLAFPDHQAISNIATPTLYLTRYPFAKSETLALKVIRDQKAHTIAVATCSPLLRLRPIPSLCMSFVSFKT